MKKLKKITFIKLLIDEPGGSREPQGHAELVPHGTYPEFLGGLERKNCGFFL